MNSPDSLIAEVLSYSCFCELMKRMIANFPHGGAMDNHFANMRSLIQILDNEMFELMHQNGDYTHFYFCYRWFLLDFKRGRRPAARILSSSEPQLLPLQSSNTRTYSEFGK